MKKLMEKYSDRLSEIEKGEDFATDSGKGYLLYFKEGWYYQNEYPNFLVETLKEAKEVLEEVEYSQERLEYERKQGWI